MAHIIQLRQRIKTVETIQKTTHAMRLTSRSTHARLAKKQRHLEAYRHEIERILSIIRGDWCAAEPQSAPEIKNLSIIIGSQKGLCGAFNMKLFRFFEQEHLPIESEFIITVGKKLTELMEPGHRLHYTFNTFTAANFFAIAQELCQHILGATGYTQVTIFSNYPQSFFLQRPTKIVLPVPRINVHATCTDRHVHNATAHTYDESVPAILDAVEKLYLKVRIEELLFESLIAEHAARFISMDASTTNAEEMLGSMKRDYNKLRQASITRELMDLIGGLL